MSDKKDNKLSIEEKRKKEHDFFGIINKKNFIICIETVERRLLWRNKCFKRF